MPFFSKSKDSKKSTTQAVEADKPKPAPYRHKPTHAATDSMAMTPSGSRSEERGAIRSANQRRMSRCNSSQSLAVLASSNNLLRRNNSGITFTSAPAALSVTVPVPSVAKHPGYAAYDAYDLGVTNSYPKAGSTRSKGKSPLSSPPMSPVDSEASSSGSSSGTPSEKSLELDAPRNQQTSYGRTTHQRSRNHSRTSSVAMPVKDLAAYASRSPPTTTYTSSSASSTAAGKPTAPLASAQVPAGTSAKASPTTSALKAKKVEATITVAPVAQKRRSKWLFGGNNTNKAAPAIAAH